MKRLAILLVAVSLFLLPTLSQAAQSDVSFNMSGNTNVTGHGYGYVDGSGGISAGAYTPRGSTDVYAEGGMSGFTTVHHGAGSVGGSIFAGAYAEKTCHSAAYSGASVSTNAVAINGISAIAAGASAGAVAH